MKKVRKQQSTPENLAKKPHRHSGKTFVLFEIAKRLQPDKVQHQQGPSKDHYELSGYSDLSQISETVEMTQFNT